MQPQGVRTAVLTTALILVLAACSSTATATPTPPVATTSPAATSVSTLPPATPTPAATATPAPTAAPAGLGGTWDGTWQDVTPDQAGGSFVLTWTQSGSALSGGIVVKGTPCLSIAVVTGSVSGSTISFGAVSGKNTVVYTGTISGTTMKGSYTAPAACEDAKGNWTATKK
ncbi:MAG: hypothetical protein ACXWN2_07715 [Candidatus Limnocylindrales bacterium]